MLRNFLHMKCSDIFYVSTYKMNDHNRKGKKRNLNNKFQKWRKLKVKICWKFRKIFIVWDWMNECYLHFCHKSKRFWKVPNFECLLFALPLTFRTPDVAPWILNTILNNTWKIWTWVTYEQGVNNIDSWHVEKFSTYEVFWYFLCINL